MTIEESELIELGKRIRRVHYEFKEISDKLETILIPMSYDIQKLLRWAEKHEP